MHHFPTAPKIGHSTDGSSCLCTIYLQALLSNTDTQSPGKSRGIEYLQSHRKHIVNSIICESKIILIWKVICLLTQSNSFHKYSPYTHCFSMKIRVHAMFYLCRRYNGSYLWIKRKVEIFFSTVLCFQQYHVLILLVFIYLIPWPSGSRKHLTVTAESISAQPEPPRISSHRKTSKHNYIKI